MPVFGVPTESIIAKATEPLFCVWMQGEEPKLESLSYKDYRTTAKVKPLLAGDE